MENILLRIESRLDDLTTAFHKLKTENEILRREILGVSSSLNSETMGLMETRSMREIVDNTELFVNIISDKILSTDSGKEIPSKTKCPGESSEKAAEEFQVVKIRSKTQTEETKFLNETFKELIKGKKFQDGESLHGTSVQAISDSIPLSYYEKTSCTIKLTNLLDSVLTDPQYYLWSDSKISGPSKVDGGLSEAFSFKGHSSYCFVLCSFAISKNLRLVILCFSSSDVGNRFGLGFAPADVSTDQTLEGILYKIPTGPDAFFLTEWSKVPIKHFMTHGNLLMKGHMSSGPRCIVLVEILEFNSMIGSPSSVIGRKQRIVDGKTLGSPRPTNNAETNSKLVRIIERFSCNIEIVNCLSVPLRNRNRWYSNSENNTFLSMEVLPLHREMFFASDQTNLKVMISYEIISTDLNLVIGLKLGPGGKSFAAAFVRFPVVTGKKKLEKLMDENQWKIHDYKTISKPSEGMQLIAIRNIRAEICMTDEERSVLKIRVFAV